ncbi:DUF1129 domain-containing protein [Streptococcus dentiloxodontae]
MNIQDLTKKNQEFINIATHQLMQDGKSDAEIKTILEDIIPTLIENQKKGITGRGLLGAPTTWAAQFSPEKHSNLENTSATAKKTAETDKTPWKMWLDTSLFLLAVVALLNGFLALTGNQTTYGLISLLILSFVGGLAMYTPYHFVYRHANKPKEERPKWWRSTLIIVASITSWFVLFSLTAFLPTILNPQLPAIALIIIGVAAALVKYYLKRKYNTQSTFAPAV